MPEKKAEAAAAATEKEPRAVAYVAFAELRPGWWALIADTESTSVYALRKELRADIAAAQQATGIAASDRQNLMIVPKEHAHFVEAAQQVKVQDTFKKVEPRVISVSSMVAGPHPQETEADIAARMASERAPEGAVVPPDAALAAQAALAAEAAARAAAVPPVDPDDDDAQFTGNPDIDPSTGLSRRSAAESVPEDEGVTIFPPDER